MRRCSKHVWQEEKFTHVINIKTAPGSINRWLPELTLDVCMRCNKVKNPRYAKIYLGNDIWGKV